MAIDNGVINQKSIEILTEGKGSKRNTNETGAVGCLNTGFESLSIKTENTDRRGARDSDTGDRQRTVQKESDEQSSEVERNRM